MGIWEDLYLHKYLDFLFLGLFFLFQLLVCVTKSLPDSEGCKLETSNINNNGFL